jgi:putative nucleotidyltransferase with HDIG domain
MVRQMGFPAETVAAVCAAGEHWDGGGYPQRLAGSEIPLAARILSLARTIEVFYTHRCAKHALDAVRERSGSWFDPDVAAAALELSRRGALFADLETGRTRERLIAAEPEPEPLPEQRLDDICRAFAEIVDAKSPFTQGHSEGVARAAERIAAILGLKAAEAQNARRAALLHDLGKLALPNFILEKPDKLEPEEWQAVKKHPFYTLEILRPIEGFGEIAEIAASHHEKLNGSGYYRNLTAARLPLAARIVAVADAFEALTSRRPQREAYPLEKAAETLRSEAGIELDADCVEAVLETRDKLRSA